MPYPYQPYTIHQTLKTVDISFRVPPGSRSRDIEVNWEAKGVTACVKHQPPTIKGEFFAAIKSKESTWQLEGSEVTLQIVKREEDIWPYLIKPGPDIDPCSLYCIAVAMENGVEGIPRDRTGAVALLRQAADKGMGDAQIKLGYIFSGMDPSYDVTPSETLAYTYFSYAANQHGSVDALLYVAMAFHTGTGVEKSPSMAEQFYQKAAAKKNDTAIYRIGLLYRTEPESADFKPDPKKALQYFQMAAEMGNIDANYSLGVAYFGGDEAMVGECDLYKAKTYFEKAAKLSDGEREVPVQLLEAIEMQEMEEAEEKEKKVKQLRRKMNVTAKLGTNARESGRFGYMTGIVVFGLIAAFGFHYLASRK